jgi:hypothetical protein
MKIGSWATIAVLLAILAATIWLGYEGWTRRQDAQMSPHRIGNQPNPGEE